MQHNALIHDEQDDVAVLVVDLKAGETASAVTPDGVPVTTIQLVEDIPLGHKVALRDLAPGQPVVKYGRCIGRVYQPIRAGQHVHTQNLRSERWPGQ